MIAQINRLVSLAESSRLKSAELACLLEFLSEAECEMDVADNCPAFINERNLGAIRSATQLQAELLNGLNEDLASSLQILSSQVEAGKPAKRGSK